MSKKILILAPIPFKSGTQLDTYLRIKATTLADLNNKIDLITFPYGDNVDIPNLNIIRFPCYRIFNSIKPGDYIKTMIYSFFVLLKFAIIKKKMYDIIFLYHTMYLIGWIFKPFIKGIFISTVYTNLESESIKWNISGNRIFLKILRKYDVFCQNHYDVIVISNDVIMKSYSKLKKLENKIIYIPYAFENSGTIIKSNIEKKKLTILYSGVFHKIQNLKIIIEAAFLFKGEDIDIILVGANKEEKSKFITLINNYNLKNVYIYEWIKNENLQSFFRDADILISARTEGTDYPMKIFEYLSYEKCILASNRPIHTGVLNNETACLFEPTPEDLAEKILYLKSNPDIVIEYGKKAKELFDEKYSFERMVNDYRKLLVDI